MPRKPRDILPGDHSHTTFRTHNREFLFVSPQHHQVILKALERMKYRFNVKIYTCVPMSNHYHFIHEAPTQWHEETEYARIQKQLNVPIQIGDLLREVLSLYVNVFNRRFDREGSIVKDRTKTVKQKNDIQEMITTFYNFANPVKAKRVKHPSEYIFHNYDLYAHGKLPAPLKHFRHLFSFPKWYMDLGQSWRQRRSRFRKLMEAYLEKHGFKTFRGATGYHGCGRDASKRAQEEFMDFCLLFHLEAKASMRAPPKSNTQFNPEDPKSNRLCPGSPKTNQF